MARLLGLDMPTKVAVTEPEGNGIPLEAIRLVMDRLTVFENHDLSSGHKREALNA
jgi:hypothetical protein